MVEERHYYAITCGPWIDPLVIAFPRKRTRDAFIVRTYPRSSMLSSAMVFKHPNRFREIHHVETVDAALELTANRQ